MYELTVVNVNMQGTSTSGESSGTGEAQCHRLSPSIQETLKGQERPIQIQCSTHHATCLTLLMDSQVSHKGNDQNTSYYRHIIVLCMPSISAWRWIIRITPSHPFLIFICILIFLCRWEGFGGARRFWLSSSELRNGYTEKGEALCPGTIHPVY